MPVSRDRTGGGPQTPGAQTSAPGGLRPLPLLVAVGLILLALPTPEGIDPRAWRLLAIFVASIVAIVIRAFPMGAVEIESLWKGYCEYMKAVKANAPAHLSLRDKNRFLWGKSGLEQLKSDVASEFDPDAHR